MTFGVNRIRIAKDNTVLQDLPWYIMEYKPVRVALRKTRDLDISGEQNTYENNIEE